MLYPGVIAKAAALGFACIQNHPSVDGNKRIGPSCSAAEPLAHGPDDVHAGATAIQRRKTH